MANYGESMVIHMVVIWNYMQIYANSYDLTSMKFGSELSKSMVIHIPKV